VDGSVTTAKIADANVTQAKLGTNVAGNGPAFSAYANSAQNMSNGVVTKVNLNVESFDTNSNFDPTTNYRFTPTVAGYYFVQAQVTLGGSSGWSNAFNNAMIYKNGSAVLENATSQPTNGNYTTASVCGLVYLNGSTDYIELYHLHAGASTNPLGIVTGATWTYMSGYLARAA
jgi:hypothetical protein